ncbi:MAG: hypothetical protein J0M34_08335 [Alphaproteobacteria bacterium]|nr:hypothetical protein [Alphaproteobacteria bacterium]
MTSEQFEVVTPPSLGVRPGQDGRGFSGFRPISFAPAFAPHNQNIVRNIFGVIS